MPSHNQPSHDPPEAPHPDSRRSRRRVVPLPPGSAAALPLASRSPGVWAAALIGLGERGDALVELTVSGSVRWWSPRQLHRTDPCRVQPPDAWDLVWARRADPDVELVSLVLNGAAMQGLVTGTQGGHTGAAVVATRSGEHAVTVGSWPGGISNVVGRGTAVDAVLLYLGLPTAPERRTPAHLVASVWADRLLAAAALVPGSISTWDDAAAHHPLARPRPGVPELVEAAGDLDRLGWDEIRVAVSAGRADWAELSPSAARWMDRGAFARWLLDRYPDLDDQRSALRTVLPAKLARTVESAIAKSLSTGPGFGAGRRDR